MTALPPSLSPWRPLLATLHPEVAEVLGPYLPRLASALGPIPAPQLTGLGDPDGIDGVSGRGSWDQLLASAWALADAAPDEFIRRAADGELPFLHLARTRPQGGWRGILWLGTGPESLGAVRLVLAAAALVLADRIRHADGQPTIVWRAGDELVYAPLVGMASLVPWLNQRTVRQPSADDLTDVLEALDHEPELDRIWGLGGPTLAAAARRAGHQALSTVEALDDDVFDVELLGDVPVRLRLPTPSPAVTLQLLQDPLAPSAAPSLAALDEIRLRWSRMGSRLFLINGRRVVWIRADALLRGELQWQTHEFSGPVLAISWVRQHPVALVRRGSVLEIAWAGGRKGAWRGTPPTLPVPDGIELDGVTSLWLLSSPRDLGAVRGRRTGSAERAPRAAAVLRDAAGTLWLLDLLNGRSHRLLHDLSEAALAFRTSDRGQEPPRAFFLQRSGSDARLIEWLHRPLAPDAPGSDESLLPFEDPHDGPIVTMADQAWRVLGSMPGAADRVLARTDARRPGELAIAVGTEDAWLLHGRDGERQPHAAPTLVPSLEPRATGFSGEVVGMYKARLQVAVLGHDRKTLFGAEGPRNAAILTLDAPLLSHAIRPRHGHLTGIDTLGRLVVVDVEDGAVLYKIPLPDRLR